MGSMLSLATRKGDKDIRTGLMLVWVGFIDK